MTSTMSLDTPRTNRSTPTQLASNTNTLRNKLPKEKLDQEEFAVEQFVNRLQIPAYARMKPEERRDFLDNVDALELFTAVQEVNRELAIVKLENHFLTDFLEKNDPKLLIGLKQRRATATMQRRLTQTSTGSTATTTATHGIRRTSSRRSVLTTTQSIYTTGSLTHKKTTDYRLNYRAKLDMAEKAAADVDKRIHDIETRAINEIKVLNARIEELRLRTEETNETRENFELHFLRDQRDVAFLEAATEKQLDRKFKKFTNNWYKNARALLGTMRLRITALQESCQQHRSDLITKADLSGILGAVDFEQLIIKRTELLQSLDDKNAHMAGLKGVTGKASMAMSEEKNIMMDIEEKGKRITNKTVEVIKQISKLETEAQFVEEGNNKDMRTLKQLKEQLERYEAPSVNQYIEKKDELLMLEKEDKMLQRKIYILNMKLNNILKKCKKKDD